MKRGLGTFVPLFVLVLATLVLSSGLTLEVTAQQAPVVRFYMFYGETCAHCHSVIDDFLPQVVEKYGDQVEYQLIEVWNDTDKYLTLLALGMKYGVPEGHQGAVPALFIGDHVLIGARDIPAELETIIDEYLAQGGVDYPSLDDLPEVVLPTPAPTVQILVAYDTAHADFSILSDLMVSLGTEYGSGLQIYPLDLEDGQNGDLVLRLNAALDVPNPPTGTPQVLIGRHMLVGLDEIERQLPGLIDTYLAEGGVTLPTWEDLEAGEATPTPTPTPKPIYIAYFDQVGCQQCARTAYDLRVIEERYPQVRVERFPMEDGENKLLNEWLCNERDVPEEKRLSTPMLFVGQDVLIGEEANLRNLLAAVDTYVSTGAEPIWEGFDPEQAEEAMVTRIESWGIFTILGAGLIDGLNPCAFATLVFLISYLTFTGRQGRDILFVGAAFALGVFLTYLLVGVGILKAVQALEFFPTLGRWVYLLTGLLCVALAIFTFRDFFRARKGRSTEMALKLPMGLRQRINKVIRENVQVPAFVAMAFVIGFVVSLIELACTGQVYYPTIVYMTSVPEFADRAFLYLALYCLMFVLPLIIVFLLNYLGTTLDTLRLFIGRYTAPVKAVTGLLFVGLSLWMAWTIADQFGVLAPWNWVLMGITVLVIAVGVVALQVLERSAGRRPSPRSRKRRRPARQ